MMLSCLSYRVFRLENNGFKKSYEILSLAFAHSFRVARYCLRKEQFVGIKNIVIKNFLMFMDAEDLKDSKRKTLKIKLPDGSLAIIVLDLKRKKTNLKLIKND